MILSGKRSLQLNEAIGGAKNSDHLYHGVSAAVDFMTVNTHTLEAFDYLRYRQRKNSFGQLIYYKGRNFCHISLPSAKHVGEVLINDGGKMEPYEYSG